MQTPRFCGHCSKCCDFDLLTFGCLGLRISCCIVGIHDTPFIIFSVSQSQNPAFSLALRVRNTKRPQSSLHKKTTRWLFRGSKRSLGSCHSKSEASLRRPSIYSRAYRPIWFRCQQALDTYSYLGIIAGKILIKRKANTIYHFAANCSLKLLKIPSMPTGLLQSWNISIFCFTDTTSPSKVT